MTQPPDSSQPPSEEQDPNKTTVFRPGDAGFGAPPPFGGSDAPIPPPPGQPPAWNPPPAAPSEPPTYGAPPPPPPPPPPPAGYGAPAYGQQQPYSPPQYGQQQYGQPGYAPPVNPYSQAAAPQRTFGAIGAITTFVGAVLGIVAFTAVSWFNGTSGSKFSNLHDLMQTHDAQRYINPISKQYFGWLGWVLLGAAVVTALLAAVPAASAFRAIGAIVGLAGLGITLWAIQFFTKHTGELPKEFRSYSEYISHARAGFWLAVAAFVLTTIGAAIGAQKKS